MGSIFLLVLHLPMKVSTNLPFVNCKKMKVFKFIYSGFIWKRSVLFYEIRLCWWPLERKGQISKRNFISYLFSYKGVKRWKRNCPSLWRLSYARILSWYCSCFYFGSGLIWLLDRWGRICKSQAGGRSQMRNTASRRGESNLQDTMHKKYHPRF